MWKFSERLHRSPDQSVERIDRFEDSSTWSSVHKIYLISLYLIQFTSKYQSRAKPSPPHPPPSSASLHRASSCCSTRLGLAFFCKFSIYLCNHLVYFNSNKLGVAPLFIIKRPPRKAFNVRLFLSLRNKWKFQQYKIKLNTKLFNWKRLLIVCKLIN